MSNAVVSHISVINFLSVGDYGDLKSEENKNSNGSGPS